MEIFWNTIAQYNEATWWTQLLITAAGILLTTQLYVEGDAGNARDGLWHRLSAEDRAAVTVPFVPGSVGLQARFPIVVAA